MGPGSGFFEFVCTSSLSYQVTSGWFTPKLPLPIHFLKYIYLFIYLFWLFQVLVAACRLFLFFLVALGLCCCTQAFSSYSERGLLFVAVCGLLIAVASLVAEHGL